MLFSHRDEEIRKKALAILAKETKGMGTTQLAMEISILLEKDLTKREEFVAPLRRRLYHILPQSNSVERVDGEIRQLGKGGREYTRKGKVWIRKQRLRAVKKAKVSRRVDGKREPQLRKHRKRLLKVYRSFLNSYLQSSERYAYGRIYFNAHIVGLPQDQDYYSEARIDLERYPAVHDLLLKALRLIAQANSTGDRITGEIEKKVDQAMEKYNLKDSYRGGLDAGCWYYRGTVIQRLIVQPLAEGSKYRKPKITLKDGLIQAPQHGFVLAGRFSSKTETKNIIEAFWKLSAELVSKFSKEVNDLQYEFKVAETTYTSFKNNLKEHVIKPLDNDE